MKCVDNCEGTCTCMTSPLTSYWTLIRTDKEMFSKNMRNFKMSQLPYFLSDVHNFCTICIYYFSLLWWNDDNSGPDFLFNWGNIDKFRSCYTMAFHENW